jgi:hypothetical protein
VAILVGFLMVTVVLLYVFRDRLHRQQPHTTSTRQMTTTRDASNSTRLPVIPSDLSIEQDQLVNETEDTGGRVNQ